MHPSVVRWCADQMVQRHDALRAVMETGEPLATGPLPSRVHLLAPPRVTDGRMRILPRHEVAPLAVPCAYAATPSAVARLCENLKKYLLILLFFFEFSFTTRLSASAAGDQ